MMNPAFDKDKRLQPLDQRNVEKSTTQMAQLHSDMDTLLQARVTKVQLIES